MITNSVEYEINRLVNKVFGFGFRADWRVGGVLDNYKIILDRGTTIDIIACVPSFLPEWIQEPLIAARISPEGSKIIISERYNVHIPMYATTYKRIFRELPKIQTMSHSFFMDYLRIYGNNKL